MISTVPYPVLGELLINLRRSAKGWSCFQASRSQTGASAVEFALIAPVLLLLIFLLADIGRLSYVQISVNSAARESARASSFGLSTTEINSIANTTAGDAAKVASLSSSTSVTVTQVRSCSASTDLGRTTEVRVSTLFKWVTPMDLFLSVAPGGTYNFNSAINVSSSGVMVCAG